MIYVLNVNHCKGDKRVENDMRSELAIKRDEWFKSDEGIGCLEVKKLALHHAHQKYLKNRLERAFLAGAIANEEIVQEFCQKVADELGIPIV